MITLVFTDVVGSSAAKRDVDLGSSAEVRDHTYLESIQIKHLRLVRTAVSEHKGTEVMTMGDSFFLTFEEPLDALRCCTAMQRRLAEHPTETINGPLCLRIGIHTGAPKHFEESWHGTDVDMAARVQSVATSQQILISHVTRQLLGDVTDFKFRPLGTFALKGVGDVRLWDCDYDHHGLRLPNIASNERKKRMRGFKLSISVSSVLISLVVILTQLWRQHELQPAAAAAPKPPGAPNSIIVANFGNKTGDPVFDTTLTQAFIIQLQQSPIITVVSAQHLRKSMRYLGKSADAPLTPAIAQDIGVREGDKAYVTGDIAQVGDSYLITVDAINPSTGDSIASAQARAAGKNRVLDALSNVATEMRTKLGESLASIQKLDTPLGQATTPSLEAFRAYALGDAEHLKGNDIPGAEGYYLQALDLDPNFAMAWARLGAVYSNGIQFGKSLDCFIHAYNLSKNVSERERFFILGNYYVSVTGNLQDMIAVSELARRTYPLESGFYTELGVAQNAMGRLEASVDSFREARRLSPDSSITNSNYLNALTQLDRYEEAFAVVAGFNRFGLNDTDDTIYTYDLHLLTGNLAALPHDMAQTRGRDDDYLMTSTEAYGHEFCGRYHEADRMWKQTASLCAAQKAQDAQANYLLISLSGRAIAGFTENFESELKGALALDKTKPTLQLAAFTAALCHQPVIARPIMADLAQRYPEDTVINQIILPQSRAALALSIHKPQVALQALEGSEPFDLISPGAYLEGLADLELHDGPGAIAAFKRATRYRGAALMGGAQDYGQAQLGLARAYVLTGDLTSARKAYQALFTTWKDGDGDLPQLMAAKKEFAALK